MLAAMPWLVLPTFSLTPLLKHRVVVASTLMMVLTMESFRFEKVTRSVAFRHMPGPIMPSTEKIASSASGSFTSNAKYLPVSLNGIFVTNLG